MVRGSMVAREIDLEEKRVCVPTPTIPDIVMPTPVVSSPAVEINDDREPVLQDLT